MRALFHEILYRPLFNALVFLYEHVTFADLGIAIILLTLIIRGVLYPLFYRSLKHQSLLQRIQPQVKKIQETHRDNKEQQAQALLALYREHRVNPFSGFLLILIQLPILIALYNVFLNGFSPDAFTDLYTGFTAPETLNHISFGLIDLTERNILIVALAAGAQYLQAKLALQKRKPAGGVASPAERMANQMVFIGPVLTVVILYNLPAAIGLYWLTTSLFSVMQQALVERSLNKGKLGETKNHDGGISKTA